MTQPADSSVLDDRTFAGLGEQANDAQARGDHLEAIRLIEALYSLADERFLERVHNLTVRPKS